MSEPARDNGSRKPRPTSERPSTGVAIIGGGPIGIELAAALRARDIPHEVFEAGTIGHSIAWWAPGTRFFSSPERIAIAGVPLVTANQDKATREEYLRYLRQVVGTHGLTIRQGTRVIDIRRDDRGRFEIDTVPSDTGVGGPTGESAFLVDDHPVTSGVAETVVVAIGDMHRARRLDVPGEDEPFVSHYMVDPDELFGREVLVVGGKNSAAEASIRLYRAKAKVTLSYRRAEFDTERVKPWILPELLWLIKHERIGFFPRTVPTRFERGRAHLATVDDDGRDTGGAPIVRCDRVLALTGYDQDQSLFERLGLELITTEQRPRHDRRTMETTVPGVFVAGTAVGGKQTRARVFIENSHAHVARIAAAIACEPEPQIGTLPEASLPES